DREIARLADTQTRIAHCPSSNLFLASGTMRLGRYLEAGLVVGLGSDVSAGPDLSLFGVMRAGAYTQSGLRTMLDEPYAALAPMDWLRLGSIEGAHALGLDADIAVIEGLIRVIRDDARRPSSVQSTIYATGKVVCPGFIDLHIHSGLWILAEPRHEPKVRQGVTTELVGVDGNAYAPFRTHEDLEA